MNLSASVFIKENTAHSSSAFESGKTKINLTTFNIMFVVCERFENI